MLRCFSHIRPYATLWTIACQAPLSMGFSGKNTGVACCALLQGIFLTQESNLCLLRLPALAGGFFTTSTTWEPHLIYNQVHIAVDLRLAPSSVVFHFRRKCPPCFDLCPASKSYCELAANQSCQVTPVMVQQPGVES